MIILYSVSQINITDIAFGDAIGQGPFGTFFTATWKGRKVAVRQGRKKSTNSSLQLHSLCHPNVITYYGSVPTALGECTVMELMPHGTLYNHIYKQGCSPLYEESLKWSIEIASALEYLHHRGIVHRNIKSGMVYIANEASVKLSIDVEISMTLADHPQGVTTVGTFRWMAPELAGDFRIEDLNLKAADVFSYAMLLYELWEHKIPFHDQQQYQAAMAVVGGERPSTSKRSPKFMIDLMQKCWNQNPEERPQISSVLLSLQQMPATPPDVDMQIIAISDIAMDESPIAQGGFGAVYKAQWKSENKRVAVKVGHCTAREIDMVSTVEPHPNIIAFYGLVKVSKHETRIIMELADQGTIYSHMKMVREKGKCLEPALSLQWAMEVASGVQHLHTNDIVHRDLKPQNVLLVGEKLQAKLTDFGSVRELPSTAVASAFGTTLLYQAPESSPMEIGQVPVISKKYDSYSYGFMLWELLSSKQLFEGLNEKMAFLKVITENLRPNVKDIRSDFKDYLTKLIQSCWQTDYKNRPTFNDIVAALQTETF